MPGNSERRGAKRSPGSKKGQTVGSGGQRRKQLKGKGPTPKANERPSHPAHKQSRSAAKRADPAGRPGGRAGGSGTRGGGPGTRGGGPGTRGGGSGGRAGGSGSSGGRGGARGSSSARAREVEGGPEWVAGRNPVVEALRAGVPATALWVAERIESDDRVRESMKLASKHGVPLMEASRTELDRVAGGPHHQGLTLQVPAYVYAHPDDLLTSEVPGARLLVALDGVTDPRNLGAVLRSAAAFGAAGVVVPSRRSAGVTATAWKVSAGAAARVPVARAVNLTRTLQAYRDAGMYVVGLDGDASVDLDSVEVLSEPLVLVVGSEGKGLSRLVRETCDVVAAIPIGSATESLNAGVAAGIALYVAGRRRSEGRA